MLSSALLSIREGVEAALVAGIILSVLNKSGRSKSSAWVWWGVIAALLVSVAVSVALTLARFELEGTAEKIFEGVSLLLAAGLLTWMIFWMKANARQQSTAIHQKISLAGSNQNIRWTLFWLTFVAVVREGIELALFLLASGIKQAPLQTWAGAVLGLAIAALIGLLWFSSTRNLSISTFFTVTNILLVFFAAGLFSRAAGEFIELNWLPGLATPLYDISRFFSSETGIGSIFQSLFGYTSSPALTQTLVYSASLIILFILLFIGARKIQPDLGSAD